MEFLSIQTQDQPENLIPQIQQSDDILLLLQSEHQRDHTTSVIIYANEPEKHILTTLTEKGCVPFRVRASSDGLHVGGVVENWETLKSIGESVEAEHQQFDLLSVEESNNIHRPFDEGRMKHVVQDALSSQQFDLLQTAHEAGYFSVPKETTSQKLAEELQMSQSTLSEQLRTAQAELFRLVFGTA
jgi:predicted DNA binding protein